MVVLEIKNVSKKYGDFQALKKVSFEVKNGIFAVLGPSGSGKTTLLRIICGLEVPDEGEVLIDGKVVSGSKYVEPWKRNVAMIFQDLALWPFMTVKEHLEFVLRHKGIEKQKWEKEIDEILEVLKIVDLKYRKPEELSGGEKQRLAIARAIIQHPKILLLDEPLANLDPPLKREILNYLKEIHKKTKIPMVYVTHNLDELEIANKVAFMHQGRIIQVGSPNELRSNPSAKIVKEYFFGTNRA
jgi:ABC-type sugar transport system ATPase subunit